MQRFCTPFICWHVHERQEKKEKEGKTTDKQKDQSTREFYVSAETGEQFEEALKFREVTGIYCSVSMFSRKEFFREADNSIKQAERAGKEIYFALPYILREDSLDFLSDYFQEMKERIAGGRTGMAEKAGTAGKSGM